jgi:hypothetical protein
MHEEMQIVHSHKGNENQNDGEIPPYPVRMAIIKQ